MTYKTTEERHNYYLKYKDTESYKTFLANKNNRYHTDDEFRRKLQEYNRERYRKRKQEYLEAIKRAATLSEEGQLQTV